MAQDDIDDSFLDVDSTQQIPSRFNYLLRQVGRSLFLFFCILLTAFLLYASFPRPGHAGLAWLAFLPFTWGIMKVRRFWSSFFYAGLAGFIFHALSLSWVYYTCVHGGGLSGGLSAAAWLGLSGLLALQMALFGGSCYFLKKVGAYFPILAACGWVAFEWVQQTVAFYAIGFPWFMLGGTQWNYPQILQLVSVTGVYGLSFCLVWVGTQLGWAITRPSVNKIVGSILLALAVFGTVYGFGHYRLERFEQMRKHQSLLSLQTALMQTNIDQYKKWDEAYEQEILEVLDSMGAQVDSSNTRLTVWPESAVPGALTEPVYATLFQKIADNAQSYQIIGSVVPEGKKQYVGAYLVGPGDVPWQSYEKVKLVPFGEFVPLASVLQSLFPNLDVLVELGAFNPGSSEQKLLNLEGVLLGSTICYESIFPQLWLAQARAGAKVFVNITNDAWFFNTAAPYQHLAANVLRAVETGRSVLRAANTGFSAVINPVGQIEQQSGLFSREIIRSSVALPIGDEQTFYTQWGDWFAWVCALVFFTLLISTIVFAYE